MTQHLLISRIRFFFFLCYFDLALNNKKISQSIVMIKTPPSSPQRQRRRNVRRSMMMLLSFIACLLITGTFITLFIIHFFRYQITLTTILPYPNFLCHQNRSCGCPNIGNRNNINSKIVGGEDASPYMYPWLVGLTDRHRLEPFCAGFIISSKLILTAAHCLVNRYSDRVQILARIHDLRDFHGDRHDIDHWIIHPQYRLNDSTHLNDIALIRIQTSFANDLQPCCLPSTTSSTYPQAKTQAIVSGWGRAHPQSIHRTSSVLQHVVLPIVDAKNIKCHQSIFDSSRQICAGYDRLSIDACSGDSGAPLLIVEHESPDNGYFIAAGIVSYGNTQCDSSLSSGVYTRISSYLDWIRAEMKK